MSTVHAPAGASCFDLAGRTAFTAGKGGLVQLTKSLATACAEDGIQLGSGLID